MFKMNIPLLKMSCVSGGCENTFRPQICLHEFPFRQSNCVDGRWWVQLVSGRILLTDGCTDMLLAANKVCFYNPFSVPLCVCSSISSTPPCLSKSISVHLHSSLAATLLEACSVTFTAMGITANNVCGYVRYKAGEGWMMSQHVCYSWDSAWGGAKGERTKLQGWTRVKATDTI